MNMAVKIVFTIIVFFGFLSLLLVGFGIQANTYQQGSFTNQTKINMTSVNTGLANIKVCDYQSDIPILGQFFWGLDCIGDGIGMLTGVATANSDNPILQVLFLGCVATIIVLIIMILRGNGII